VRSTLAWLAIPVLAAGGIFCWQQSQIVHLRAQVARQAEAIGGALDAPVPPAPAAPPLGLRRADANGVAARADERRLILDQYQDILAEMNLPAATASRLQDLLADRVEAVLDAQDAAMREGFAEGSAETARAVTLAIAEVDRQIADLIGTKGNRVLDGLPPAVAPEPAVAPLPPAPLVVVNVVVPSAPAYAEPAAPAEPAASSDATAAYSGYPYYPVADVLVARGGIRPFARVRSAVLRAYPSPFLEPAPRVAMRTR
jgi:hypothetical protein